MFIRIKIILKIRHLLKPSFLSCNKIITEEFSSFYKPLTITNINRKTSLLLASLRLKTNSIKNVKSQGGICHSRTTYPGENLRHFRGDFCNLENQALSKILPIKRFNLYSYILIFSKSGLRSISVY